MMKTSFLHRLPLFPPTPTPTFPRHYSPPSHSQHLRLRSSPPSLVTLVPQKLRPRRVLCSLSARPCAGGDGDFDRFAEAAKDFNLLPMYKTMSSDEIDPDTAYKRLTRDDDPLSPSFISTLPSSKERYTLIGAQPVVEFVAKENFVTIIDRWEGTRREEFVENPLLIPEWMMKKWKPQPLAGLPDTFSGGWFGYFSYDTFRYMEKNLPFSSAPKDDQNLPDVDICLYDNVIVFDHKQKKLYCIHWVLLDRYPSVEEAFDDGIRKLDSLFDRVHDSVFLKIVEKDSGPQKVFRKSEVDYKSAELEVRRRMPDGGFVLLSQRYDVGTSRPPFEMYQHTEIDCPCRALIKGRACSLFSASQEILVVVKQVSSRSLSWARRTGRVPNENDILGAQLFEDERKLGMHKMILGQEARDIEKVAKPGSVYLENLFALEFFSLVVHLTCTATGELLEHLSCWDALRAVMPGAAASGFPKAEAIKLIDQLEPARRGPYGGGFGCISFFGDMEMAVALHMAVFTIGNRVLGTNYGKSSSSREPCDQLPLCKSEFLAFPNL